MTDPERIIIKYCSFSKLSIVFLHLSCFDFFLPGNLAVVYLASYPGAPVSCHSQTGDVCCEKGIVCLSERLSGTLIKCCCRSELWDRFISIPFVKDGQLIPMLKGMRKEAMKHSFSEFREFKQLLSRVQLNCHRVLPLS